MSSDPVAISGARVVNDFYERSVVVKERSFPGSDDSVFVVYADDRRHDGKFGTCTYVGLASMVEHYMNLPVVRDA